MGFFNDDISALALADTAKTIVEFCIGALIACSITKLFGLW